MTYIDARSIADKIAKILSDNRVTPSEWKYVIPMYLVQNPVTIVANAKNLADGIQYNIDLYGPNIPDSLLAYDPISTDYILE